MLQLLLVSQRHGGKEERGATVMHQTTPLGFVVAAVKQVMGSEDQFEGKGRQLGHKVNLP